MKTRTHCPKCKSPLLNTQVKLRNGNEIWKKSCVNRVDHDFVSLTTEGNDDSLAVVSLTINFQNQIRCHWILTKNKIFVTKGGISPLKEKGQEIPWFEPDFDAYDKLINKIKKYVIFS